MTWVNSFPPEIVFGKGSDAQIAASEIFNEVVVQKFGASLNFTKCYDSMDPRGTAHLLLHGGWPRGNCSGAPTGLVRSMQVGVLGWAYFVFLSLCGLLYSSGLSFWAVGFGCVDGFWSPVCAELRACWVHSVLHGQQVFCG